MQGLNTLDAKTPCLMSAAACCTAHCASTPCQLQLERTPFVYDLNTSICTAADAVLLLHVQGFEEVVPFE